MRKANRRSLLLSLILSLALFVAMIPMASAQEQITLSLGIASDSYLEFYQNVMIPEFEARYPHIKVEAFRLGWGADGYLVRYAGGIAPDVFQGGTGMFGLAGEGMMAPLNRHIERHGMQDFINQLPPAVVQALSIDGEIYGLPFSFSSDNLTYLANRFEEAALDPDRPPDTWDEFLEYARRLSRYDSNGELTYQGFYMSSHHNNFAPILYQAGGSWMNEDFTEVTFGDERGLEAVQFVHSMLHEHRVIDASRTLGDMEEGGAAMEYRSASAFVNPAHSPFYTQDDVRIAIPPRGRARGQRITPNTWLVSAVSEHKDEAFDFIAFALEFESVLKMGQEVGVFPVWTQAAYHPPWSDDPRWITALEAVQYGQLEPLTSPHWEYIRRNFVQSELPRIYYEGEPPSLIQESMRRANAWLQEQLNR